MFVPGGTKVKQIVVLDLRMSWGIVNNNMQQVSASQKQVAALISTVGLVNSDTNKDFLLHIVISTLKSTNYLDHGQSMGKVSYRNFWGVFPT